MFPDSGVTYVPDRTQDEVVSCRGGESLRFGIRIPSLTGRIAARTSLSRFVRHSVGLKAPRGFGWLTSPSRALYNRIYARTTVKADGLIVAAVLGAVQSVAAFLGGVGRVGTGPNHGELERPEEACPRCGAAMVTRTGRRGRFLGCSRFPRCRGTSEHRLGRY